MRGNGTCQVSVQSFDSISLLSMLNVFACVLFSLYLCLCFFLFVLPLSLSDSLCVSISLYLCVSLSLCLCLCLCLHLCLCSCASLPLSVSVCFSVSLSLSLSLSLCLCPCMLACLSLYASGVNLNSHILRASSVFSVAAVETQRRKYAFYDSARGRGRCGGG